jgi:hypothetical protein
MKVVAKKPQAIAAALIAGLAALALAGGFAEASPPSPRGAVLTRVTVENPRSSSAVPNERGSGRLDLRAPSDFAAARTAANSGSELSASGSVPFPSPQRAWKHQPIEEQPIEEHVPSLGNTGLGTSSLAMKNISRAEELTRRLHREGLPIARLWQTHSAMVSLGLSPRGKPGIWLIQKIP